MTKINETHLNEALTKVLNKMHEKLDSRITNFITELILSGDIYVLHRKQFDIEVVNENTMEIMAENLVCYEPYKGQKELKKKIKELEEKIDGLKDELQSRERD